MEGGCNPHFSGRVCCGCSTRTICLFMREEWRSQRVSSPHSVKKTHLPPNSQPPLLKSWCRSFPQGASPFPLCPWTKQKISIKCWMSCSSANTEGAALWEHLVVLQWINKEPLFVYFLFFSFFFLHFLLSRLFITAKLMFNGKTLQRMSPWGPALFLKAFMSVYIMLCDLFWDRLSLAVLDGGQNPFISLARKPIYQREHEACCQPGARELDVCSAADASLPPFLISTQKFSKTMDNFSLVVLFGVHQPYCRSQCWGVSGGAGHGNKSSPEYGSSILGSLFPSCWSAHRLQAPDYVNFCPAIYIIWWRTDRETRSGAQPLPPLLQLLGIAWEHLSGHCKALTAELSGSWPPLGAAWAISQFHFLLVVYVSLKSTFISSKWLPLDDSPWQEFQAQTHLFSPGSVQCPEDFARHLINKFAWQCLYF